MNQDFHEKFGKIWPKIVAKAWSDEAFKQRLLKEPRTVLKELGIELPKDVVCKVQEAKEKEFHLLLPPKPAGELGEQELYRIAAGGIVISPDEHYVGCKGEEVDPEHPKLGKQCWGV